MSEKSPATRRRLSGRTWLGLALAACAVVFILQNRSPVAVQLFAVRVVSPQWLTLSVVFLLGMVVAWLLSRRRR
ncbi:LapA family protein [Georgenia sp. SYP-B2076]|uniref:LapA family protein n=1 Tax=Georgenia sp. SYP-B2076 TaxID=2495881 RepID=UPI000F8EB486|nr:LapA family protein [Georgenia sp. SYP-B2076]